MLGIAQCLYPKGGFAQLERKFDTVTSWSAYDVIALAIIFVGGVAICIAQLVFIVGMTPRNK